MTTTADTQADGRRWYVLPDGTRLMSVTTIMGHIDKPGLVPWATRHAADAARERAIDLLSCEHIPECGKAGTPDEECGACWPCLRLWISGASERVRDAAADLGRRVHSATEARDLHGDDEQQIDEDIAAHYAAYTRWVDLYRPEIIATEAVVISRAWQYAGQLDKVVRFPEDSPLPKQVAHLAGKTVVVDTKSGALYREAGIQINAYAAAETIQLPDGSEEPMPHIDAGMILHLRPDKAQMRAVPVNPGNFAVFASAMTIARAQAAPLATFMSRPATIYRAPVEA